jgi:ATP-binding cassette subfamily C (CFTR/MRP) protein 1
VAIFVAVYAINSMVRLISHGWMLWWLFGVVAVRSASKIHKVLVVAAFHAPMSFFHNVEIGSLINRFSSDMTVVDLALPMTVWSAMASKWARLCIDDSKADQTRCDGFGS